jgi:hypothetical protein
VFCYLISFSQSQLPITPAGSDGSRAIGSAGGDTSSASKPDRDILSQDQPWLLYVYNSNHIVELFVEFSVAVGRAGAL